MPRYVTGMLIDANGPCLMTPAEPAENQQSQQSQLNQQRQLRQLHQLKTNERLTGRGKRPREILACFSSDNTSTVSRSQAWIIYICTYPGT